MTEARSPYLVALLNPLHLAMLGLTVAAGLCAAWWLFPVGLVLWGLMVIIAAQDPQLRLRQTIEARAPLAQRFTPYFDRLERNQSAIYRGLASAKASNRRALEALRPEIDALTEQVYRLCLNMTDLENHRLVEQSNADSQKDLVKINELITNANDPTAKREYEESRQALEKRLADLKALANQLDRFEALLTNMQQETDRIVTEIVRLQALEPAQVAQQVQILVQALRKQAEDFRTFGGEAAAQKVA